MKYNRINELKDYYEDKLNIHKHGAKAVNWRDKKSQYLRFKKICEIGSFNKKKVLDVGCGLGHLKDFLKISKIKTNYIGIDISEKMILRAKKRCDDKNFYCLDILKISNKDIKKLKSDYVINCGLFTVKNNLDSDTWWRYMKKMIVNMNKLSRKGISFNLMKNNVDYKDKHLHYQSIDQLVNFIEKKISKKIIIKNDYNLWEYTCHIFK